MRYGTARYLFFFNSIKTDSVVPVSRIITARSGAHASPYLVSQQYLPYDFISKAESPKNLSKQRGTVSARKLFVSSSMKPDNFSQSI
jgi:hypothetical protein